MMGFKTALNLKIVSAQNQIAKLELEVASLGIPEIQGTIDNVAWTCYNLVKEHNSLMVVVDNCVKSIEIENEQYEVDKTNEIVNDKQIGKNPQFELDDTSHGSNHIEDMIVKNTKEILQNKLYLLDLIEEREAWDNEKRDAHARIDVLKEQVSLSKKTIATLIDWTKCIHNIVS